VLEEFDRPDEPYRLVLAVSGYAAWALLEGEDGMHVWEVPADAKKAPARRGAVRVRVAPQPEAPVDDPLARATDALGRPQGASPDIVRRYRETPSPLVRDVRRGWRTGHLDRVLAGDFDLF
jgi:ATP-dependent Clp protease ATP-binding subunit ClpC